MQSFFQTNPKKKATIILDTLPLKMEVADRVDLEDLVVRISRIFLKIFLVISEEVGEEVLEEEIQIIEVQI